MRRSASISGRLTVDRKQFTADLAAAKGQVEKFAGTMKSLGGATLGGGGGRGVVGSWTEWQSKIQLVGAGLSRVGAAAGSLFKTDLKAEGAIRSLAAVSQGTESVREQMEALSELGKKPGIGFMEAVQASAALQSVGVDSKKSREMLEQFSNALASVSGSKEDLEGVALSLRQIMGTGVVDAQNIKEISRRIPQFGPIAEGADKGDPRKWLDEVTVGLSKLPRVVAGAQEALDNLGDSWERFKSSKSGGAIGNAAQIGANTLAGMISSGDFSLGNFKKLADAEARKIVEAGEDPVKRLEPKPEELARRAASRAEMEQRRAEQREEAAAEALRLAAQQQKLELALAEARARGNDKEIATAEDALDIFREAAKLAEELAISEERAANFIREQNKLRRESEARIEKAKAGPVAGGKKVHHSMTTDEFRKANVASMDTTQFAGLDGFAAAQSSLRKRNIGNLVENNVLGPLNGFVPRHTNTPRTDANAARARERMKSAEQAEQKNVPGPGNEVSELRAIRSAIERSNEFLKGLQTPADRLKSTPSAAP